MVFAIITDKLLLLCVDHKLLNYIVFHEKMIASSFIFVLFYMITLQFFFVSETNKLLIKNSLIRFHASFVGFFFSKRFETTIFERSWR